MPPYFGYTVEGRLVDLSAGGMAIFIDELIPPDSDFQLRITFPDQSVISTPVRVRYTAKKGTGYLHGIEFLALAPEMALHISQMSADYIDCEQRIAAQDENPCRKDCAFFRMCRKRQKLQSPATNDAPLELVFSAMPAKVA